MQLKRARERERERERESDSIFVYGLKLSLRRRLVNRVSLSRPPVPLRIAVRVPTPPPSEITSALGTIDCDEQNFLSIRTNYSYSTTPGDSNFSMSACPYSILYLSRWAGERRAHALHLRLGCGKRTR